jgi:hypothetical protein
MIWPILALVLTQAPDATAYAYNPNPEAAWCAPRLSDMDGMHEVEIKPAGWRTFPSKPAWCSPGVVMETAAEHRAHGKRGPCEIEWATWQVALRKTEQRFREAK